MMWRSMSSRAAVCHVVIVGWLGSAEAWQFLDDSFQDDFNDEVFPGWWPQSTTPKVLSETDSLVIDKQRKLVLIMEYRSQSPISSISV